ncbi:MAG TPA: 5-deoxy-glucuronate isomerase [Steroidobacteraceae bacterium]|jgi:5-deoxy-glucuronate isomerase|nr:5-deoxy-glucuronate isomerase [Steroidobacteraceae bacterium]
MSATLLLKPHRDAGQVHRITPESAGWRYVGFEVVDLEAGERLEREEARREQCFVILSGRLTASVAGRDLGALGARASPFEGRGHAVYAPPGARVLLEAGTAAEVAVCSAPAAGRFPARVIEPAQVGEERRGAGTNTRHVRHILPETQPAESLIVVEVITPGGHWSSYPPHKHDTARPGETQLEETYYHRLARPGAFAFQRVYTDDRSLDETLSVEDRDVVLVPRGYHPVSAPHGFDLYYLNAMAGPVRSWQITTAPGYESVTRQR